METEKNIQSAFSGECQAYRKYNLYAAKAEEEGLPEIAKLFRGIAEEEVHHAAEHAELSGLVKSTKENLMAAINGERYESEEMYPGFAEVAKKEGNEKAADRFSEIAGDEKEHLKRYQEALNNLR